MQARIVTAMNNIVDVEGPLAGTVEATLLIRLALGQSIAEALHELPGYDAPPLLEAPVERPPAVRSNRKTSSPPAARTVPRRRGPG